MLWLFANTIVTCPTYRLVVRYPALAVLAELPRLRLPVVRPETETQVPKSEQIMTE